MDNIILLHIDYSLYYVYLNICCSALSAGKGGGGVNAMLTKHIIKKYMA